MDNIFFTPEDDQNIDAYLTGNLPEAAKQAFEKRLQADKSLANEVDFRRNLQRTLQHKEDLAALTMLQSMIKEAGPVPNSGQSPNPDIKTPPKMNPWFWGGISVIVFLSVGLFSWVRYQDHKLEETGKLQYNAKWRYFEMVETLPEAPVLAADIGLAAYSNKNFPEAITFLSRAPASDDIARFYLALALKENDNIASAIKTLEDLRQQPAFLRAEEVTWRLALLYLASGEPQRAKPLVLQSMQMGTFQQDAASLAAAMGWVE